MSSAEAITAASGTSLDLTAARDAHLSTGRKLLLHAGQGLAAFAHKAGMKLIAAAGKVSLQAQSDEMELIAAKLLRLASLESILLESGKGITLRSGGAQITLADGKITLSAANGVEIKAPGFNFNQGGGGQFNVPHLPASSLTTDERFVIHNEQTGEPIAGRAYRATLDNGQVIEGLTDAQGRTALSPAQAIQLVRLVLP